MDNSVSFEDVAKYMLGHLSKSKELYQEDIADNILKKYGDGFIYINDNGNLSIHK